MKKLITPILLLVVFVSTPTAFAQSKADQRRAARIDRQDAYITKLARAIKDGQFTFTAQTFQASVGNPINVTYPNNYLSLYGNVIDVELPYYSFDALPMSQNTLNFIDAPALYTVKSDGKNYYVTIEVNVTSNDNVTSVIKMGTYNCHLTITADSGYAVLTIIPSEGSAATYTGNIEFN